jgi:hypothetical protein
MTPEQQFWWNWWVNFGVAGGTVAAVLVALFGEWFRARLFSPKLTIELDKPLGVPTPIQITSPTGESRMEAGRFYHVRVSNPARWPAATQVQVNLMKIEEPGPDGEWQMTWGGEVPLRWSLQEIRPLTRVVGPPAVCDLCSVVKGKWVELHPLIAPHNLTDLARRREKVQMIVTLQAQAAEANSDAIRIKISWDGEWKDGEAEMAKHLIIRAVD